MWFEEGTRIYTTNIHTWYQVCAHMHELYMQKYEPYARTDNKNTQEDIIFNDLPPIFEQKGDRKQASKGVNQANGYPKARLGDTYTQKA